MAQIADAMMGPGRDGAYDAVLKWVLLVALSGVSKVSLACRTRLTPRPMKNPADTDRYVGMPSHTKDCRVPISNNALITPTRQKTANCFMASVG